MLRITDINQSVIATPHIRMNNRFDADSPANNGLQRLSSAIRNNFGINFTVTFENTEDDCFAGCSATTLATNVACPKIGFVNFDLARKRRLTLTILSKAQTNFQIYLI